MHWNEGHAGSPLEIAVRTTGLLDASVLPRVEKRVRAALQRYAAHIRAVRVHPRDINGPRGGRDKRCKIQISLDHGKTIIIEDTEEDMYAAIDLAAERADRALVRQMAKNRAYTHEKAHELAAPDEMSEHTGQR